MLGIWEGKKLRGIYVPINWVGHRMIRKNDEPGATVL